MTISLEIVVQAWLAATPEHRQRALDILQGAIPRSEPYLSLRDLSRSLGFGVTTLRRWRVPGHAVGGAKRYRLGEVEAYIASDEFRRRQAALRAERRDSKRGLPPS